METNELIKIVCGKVDNVLKELDTIKGRVDTMNRYDMDNEKRIYALELRHNMCPISKVEEMIEPIPSVLSEIKNLREDQKIILCQLQEIKKETEVIRFLYKYPKIAVFLILSIAGGGVANVVKLFL